MSEGQSPPSGSGPEAFIDALGVVIARLMTVLVVALTASFPASVLVFYFGGQFAGWTALLSFAAFVGSSSALVVEYIYRIKGIELSDHFVDLAPIGKAFLVFCAILMAPVLIGAFLFANSRAFTKSFLQKSEFDIVLMFFLSAISMIFLVYSVGQIDNISSIYFVSIGRIELFDALRFVSDLIWKGVLFDIFEHFSISASDIVQTQDLFGRMITFVIRVTSSALVISTAVEIFNDTRKRLSGS